MIVNSAADLDHSEAEAISGHSFAVLLFLTLPCPRMGHAWQFNRNSVQFKTNEKSHMSMHLIVQVCHLVPSAFRGKPVIIELLQNKLYQKQRGSFCSVIFVFILVL